MNQFNYFEAFIYTSNKGEFVPVYIYVTPDEDDDFLASYSQNQNDESNTNSEKADLSQNYSFGILFYKSRSQELAINPTEISDSAEFYYKVQIEQYGFNDFDYSAESYEIDYKEYVKFDPENRFKSGSIAIDDTVSAKSGKFKILRILKNILSFIVVWFLLFILIKIVKHLLNW